MKPINIQLLCTILIICIFCWTKYNSAHRICQTCKSNRNIGRFPSLEETSVFYRRTRSSAAFRHMPLGQERIETVGRKETRKKKPNNIDMSNRITDMLFCVLPSVAVTVARTNQLNLCHHRFEYFQKSQIRFPTRQQVVGVHAGVHVRIQNDEIKHLASCKTR